ncbi:hypothetical protein PENTCL1PPCAC_5431 [Pristionchus entomophagus]|uniref:Ribosomal protein n=1 Tax=Pristionchus entomophagus TaxID=358040 RepID=A0AAV5SUP7_9BILA|nr:hypothetical protein PENTCL1PPCAC_5431 [Pristionchus entomophagus]
MERTRSLQGTRFGHISSSSGSGSRWRGRGHSAQREDVSLQLRRGWHTNRYHLLPRLLCHWDRRRWRAVWSHDNRSKFQLGGRDAIVGAGRRHIRRWRARWRRTSSRGVLGALVPSQDGGQREAGVAGVVHARRPSIPQISSPQPQVPTGSENDDEHQNLEN